MKSRIDDSEISVRLSRIQTRWTLVFEAHGDASDAAAVARRTLLAHYQGAVYRYLLGAVRDPDIAEELAHDFAVRLLSGGMHRASPDCGKFRKYLKTVLINLVNDHFKFKRESPRQFSPENLVPAVPPENGETSQSFEECLQEDFLARTWAELEAVKPKYYSVLLARVENSDLSSAELAEKLAELWKTKVSAVWVRKALERARAKFAKLLVEEVRKSLDVSSNEELEKELNELNLLSYCRSALVRYEKP